LKSKPTEPAYRTVDDLTLLTYRELALPGIAHGIVVVKGSGSDRDVCVGRARDALAISLGASLRGFVVPDQIHSNKVVRVTVSGSTAALSCDALVTDQAGIAIGVTVADCVPLFAFNTEDRVVGLAHSGWRGMASGMIEEFVRALSRIMHRPASTCYIIGASIGECCYEVGRDFLDAFGEDEVRSFACRNRGRTSFDLKSAAASRLAGMGVSPARISIDRTCTSCRRDILCSYRADGKACGRMLAYIMLTA
jgi:YfiH family protein